MIINETLTRGIFNCRNSSKFKACSSHQVHRNLENEELRNRQLKHTTTVRVQFLFDFLLIFY